MTNTTLPKSLEYHIITDKRNNDRILIKLVDVKILSFVDLSVDLYKLEGEENWYQEHVKLFDKIAKMYDTSFNLNDQVVFEIWEVIHIY